MKESRDGAEWMTSMAGVYAVVFGDVFVVGYGLEFHVGLARKAWRGYPD